ncbi:hypothetical protein PAXINDRAFT_115994 [Paxillus involutus ATCC 200175]|uniref:Uncharacterized protein n=1 Tax=Paxillus involutus ATCC 200175 TaxID=664439 RepID=A0A0C9TVN9_PAXIN|nr:hypothetical protein PAXINDRAFT_115994 [Paxillus involutus ATCC 200175]
MASPLIIEASTTDTSPSAPSVPTKATALTPPTGWTNDPDSMDLDYYWQGRNGDLKATLAKWHNLPDAQPLITRLPDFGGVSFLFQSGTKYYVWNGVADVVWSIESPTSLEEIYQTISKRQGWLGALTMKNLTEEEEEGGGVNL